MFFAILFSVKKDVLLNPGLKMAATTDVTRRPHYIRDGWRGGGYVMEVTP